MIKARYRPTFLAQSFYEIPPEFYQKMGMKNLLLDLDNTLAPYHEKEPSEKTKAWIEELKKAGLHLYIASNNTSARVTRYAALLGVEALSGLLKPFSFRLKKILKKEGFIPKETVLIGDQLMTDIPAASGAKIRSILVEPLDKAREPWVTRWNRLFEKKKRQTIMREGQVPSWKEKV
ncbi:MAG: YqeG family HAD IIIA-type phosphatase [Bacilli bacterium]